MAELTPGMMIGFPKNGPTDLVEYYRRPLVGQLFRERVNRGLRLLPPRRIAGALEVGYGAGAVLVTLAAQAERLSGVDLDADPGPVQDMLSAKGSRAQLAAPRHVAPPNGRARLWS